MRLNNTYREKLLNAILYFSQSVKNPTKVKVFKLLFFLDFQHFKETGRSVTNLDYHAYGFGPIPKILYEEIRSNTLPEDFSKSLALVPFKSEVTEKEGALFKARVKPNLSVFSPRERRILENLATVFKNVDAKMISDISHFKNHPWDKTIKEKGRFAKIDYELALDNEARVSIEEAQNAIRERQEMLKAFPPHPKL